MHKELFSIQIIRDYMSNKGLIQNKVKNIDEAYEFFEYLSTPKNGKKFNSLYILNYLHQYIVSDEVAKRKTSSRVFEDLLGILFNGEVADNAVRKNLHQEVPSIFEMVKDKMAGNKREKIDLIFDDNFGISLKTLLKSNKEINLGSFEKKILFDGFDVVDKLQERKSEDKIGLGSKPQFKNLLNLIKEKHHYDKFKDRFEKMFKFVFSDDIIFAIKDNNKLDLYFFSGVEFTDFIIDKLENIESFLSVVNRWEGNSIRIDRTLLLNSCTRVIQLDLTILDKTCIKLMNEFDFILHETYVKYFNEDDNSKLRDDLTIGLDKLFEKFEEDMEGLK